MITLAIAYVKLVDDHVSVIMNISPETSATPNWGIMFSKNRFFMKIIITISILVFIAGCSSSQHSSIHQESNNTSAADRSEVDQNNQLSWISNRDSSSEVVFKIFNGNEDISSLDDGVWLFFKEGCSASESQLQALIELQASIGSNHLGIVNITNWEKAKSFPFQNPKTPWTFAIKEGVLMNGYAGAHASSSAYWHTINKNNLTILLISNGFMDGDLSSIPYEVKFKQEEVDNILKSSRKFKREFVNVSMENIKAPNVDFSKKSFFASNFRNAVLSNSDFSNTYISKTDFTGANLDGVNFQDALFFDVICPDGTLQSKPCNESESSR